MRTMSRGGPCNHRNCAGGPCKSLTDEELTPTPADVALARQLVAEGWIQTSAKYRHIRRWRVPGPPAARDLIAPEHRDTPWGRRAIAAIERSVTSSSALHSEHAAWDVTLYRGDAPRKGPPGEVGCYELADEVEPNPLIEERTLTPSEFRAYKAECRRVENGGRRYAPEHAYASELGDWAGQPDRDSPRTMMQASAPAVRERYDLRGLRETRVHVEPNYSAAELVTHARVLADYAADDAKNMLEAAAAVPEPPPEVEPAEPLIAHGAGPAAPRAVHRHPYTKGKP